MYYNPFDHGTVMSGTHFVNFAVFLISVTFNLA